MAIQQLPPPPPITSLGFADPVWARWLNLLRARVVSLFSALVITSTNGFSGSSTTSDLGVVTISLSTTVTGILKGDGTAITAANPGTDYIQNITVDAPLSSTGGGTPDISMSQASALSSGWLSQSDWSIFNSKGTIVTSTVTGVSLATGTPANVTSITLPVGRWQISGNVRFIPAAATVQSALEVSASIVSGVHAASPLYAQEQAGFGAGLAQTLPVPTQYITVLTPTLLYLVASASFSLGVETVDGILTAESY